MIVETPSSQPTCEIDISVVAARNGRIWQRSLRLPVGSTAQQALHACGYFLDFPQTVISDIVMGVYGSRVLNTYQMSQHDRLEIYSPLKVDPKIARRRRAAHREKVKNIKKKMPVNDLTQP